MKELKIKIGLEVHIQLDTKSKLFCGCSLNSKKPNEKTCPTCLGLPGSKPRLNKKALEYALRLSLATNSLINKEISFSRKIYFYPDLSKNYQITQYESPISIKGFLTVKNKKINIQRIHIEEDPAMLHHDLGNSDYVLIDYNRSGIPLIELVTDPDISNTEEAKDFMEKLLSILEYLDIFNKKIGVIKADVNVSINNGQRVEIKNVNGIKKIEKVILYEIMRQEDLLARNEPVTMETRAYNPKTDETISLRKKETEEDYGYIFDPDLTTLKITDSLIAQIKKEMPELPEEKIKKFSEKYNLTNYESSIICSELAMANMFEKVASKINPFFASKQFIGHIKKVLNYNSLRFSDSKIKSSHLVKLFKLVLSNKLTPRGSELILREIILDPAKFEQLTDNLKKQDLNLETLVEDIIKKNQKAVQDYRQGNQKSIHYLLGQVIKNYDGKLDSKQILDILKKKIS